ncbi:unnamed protein product [Miscanthus lutarioriparius]|uniref:RRM domain-containing protein n=1 Tax=Miscanthus lutarioriparius TaxID=422564 RepID=A0A811PP10_9POAL|nr:unnamed protein product [Miscanthus lutarioriparius]
MSDVDEYRCFVGSLSWSTTEADLKDAFRKFGHLTEAKVVLDKFSGRSRGFGFVTFDDKKSMEEAIEAMNGMDLDGRNITVERAQAQSSGIRDRDGDRDYSRGGGDRDRYRGDYSRGRDHGSRDFGGGRGGGGGGIGMVAGTTSMVVAMVVAAMGLVVVVIAILEAVMEEAAMVEAVTDTTVTSLVLMNAPAEVDTDLDVCKAVISGASVD